ncbi:MAG TPA: hypothetical protein VHU88_12280 [Sporichthyaceae bacterium]|jgi:hypothetical protein|nr:hypothetical protein [Sporichthyaceae bacterium]
MRRYATVLAALSIVAGLAGCGSKDNTSAASFTKSGDTAGANTGAPGAGPGPGLTPASAAPTMKPAAALAMATSDVSKVSPALVTWFNSHGYATTLEQVAQAMVKAGIAMDPTDSVATYQYDAAAKQFKLCVENDSHAWARYDTALHKVAGSNTSGGCPQS